MKSIKFLSVLLLWIMSTAVFAQTSKISVTVTDGDGVPTIGAGVQIKGTNKGAITDANGVAILEDVEPKATLVVSALGFSDVEVPVAGRSNINVVLNLSSEYLNEVVVVGYGTMRRRDLTGALSSIGGDKLSETGTPLATQALQGRIAGVEVKSSSGQPGASPQIRVRGANSIKGDNDPLWIIDGFPGNINMISPDDIESMEVLKDASATAIYGSRGANGVILVTTKRARGGKATVNFNASVGVQVYANKLDVLDTKEYMTYLNQKQLCNNLDPLFTETDIANYKGGTDWQDEIFRPAILQNYSLGITGGNDKLRTSTSFTYANQDGIMIHTGYERYTFLENIEYDIFKWFSFNASVNLSRTNHNRLDSEGGSRGGSPLGSAIYLSPLASPKNEDGSWNDLTKEYTGGLNPVAYLNEHSEKWRADRTNISAALIFKPIEGLSIQLGANYYATNERTDTYTTNNYVTGSTASISTNLGHKVTSNNIVTYSKGIGKHYFNLMGGLIYENSTTEGFNSGTAKSFASSVFQTYKLEAASVVAIPSSSYSSWTLLSGVARANYNFDDRYLATVNFRADGSSRYNKGNKWGYFPSASVAWHASNEKFLKNKSWLSDLKVRLGYGITGSTAIDPYSTMTNLVTYHTVFNLEYADVAYASPDNYVKSLVWETTSQTNVGVDLAMFSNRLKVTADAYYKLTTNLLNDVELPRSSGYTKALQNVGSLSNRGLELQIDGRIIDSKIKWDLGGNISFNRSKVIELAGHKDILATSMTNFIVSGETNIMSEGKEMYLFYGYKEDGYNDNGQIVYKDLDGDGSITTADRTFIGNPNPKFLYGITSRLSWNGLSLDMFWQGSQGNQLFSFGMVATCYDYGYNGNVLKGVLYDHWTHDNTNATYPNLLMATNYKVSERFVYDASYLRLKNLELSYDIPLKKMNVFSHANVYISGQNLLTITNYPFIEPDVNAKGGGSSVHQGIDTYMYPTARTYTTGVRLTF